MIYESLSPHASPLALAHPPSWATYRRAGPRRGSAALRDWLHVYVANPGLLVIGRGQGWGCVHYGKGMTVVRVRFGC